MNTDALTDQDLTDVVTTEQAATTQNLDEYLTDEYNYRAPRRGDIRTGVVVGSNEHGIIMDVGSKREGLVPAEDLAHLDEKARAEIQVGAAVPVFVVQPEDGQGGPVLSIHQAHLYEDWLKVEQMMGSGELYEGKVSGHNRGGLIVQFGKIRGFIPASQIVGLPKRLREDQRRQRLADMVGEPMGLRVIEVDRQRQRLIFSQRRAFRAWQEVQRERVIAQLAEGETRHGKVTSITEFGAFVDLGGADGLIHVSELSWRRVENPRELLKIGQEVDVYVLNVDQQRKRIALSLKKLQPDPWTQVDGAYKVGQMVEGHVTRVLDFGAFVALDIGIEGLLHAREMIGTPEHAPADIVKPGETLPVKIIGIDTRRRRVDLSARQVRKDEWERWVAEHQAVPEAPEEEITAPEAAVGATAEEEAHAEENEVAPQAEAVLAEEATGSEAAVGATAEEEAHAEENEVAPQAEAVLAEEATELEAAVGAAAEEEAHAEENEVAPQAEAVLAEEATESEATVGATAEEEAHAEENETAPQPEAVLAEEAVGPVASPVPDVASEAEAVP